MKKEAKARIKINNLLLLKIKLLFKK